MAPPRDPAAVRGRLRAAWSGPVGAALGALGARTAYRLLIPPPQRGCVHDVFRTAEHTRDVWRHTNFRGEEVTRLAGPALALGVCAAAALAPGCPRRLRAAAVLATAGAAAFGAYDDLPGNSGGRRIAGHAGALARGRITTGAVRIAGVGASGLAAGGLLARGEPLRVLADGALIAGSANLANLLDVRPGRAAKAALLLGSPLLTGPAAGTAGTALGAAAALLPEELDERAMLGDLGANALGAALGTAAAAGLPPRGRTAALCAVAALTAAAEFVDLSDAMAAVGPLRRLDELGRRPAQTPGPAPVHVPLHHEGPALGTAARAFAVPRPRRRRESDRQGGHAPGR